MIAAPGAISRYISRRLLAAFAGVFCTCAGLIFLIDLVEMLRRGAKFDVPLNAVVLMAAYRTPGYGEQVLPFAVLIGAMVALSTLSRRNELVVARAIGMSAWRFLTPVIVVTLLIGIFSVTVYNPMSAYLKEVQAQIEAQAFGPTESLVLRANHSGLWLRQQGVDGQSVVHADRSLQDGVVLESVTVYAFDEQRNFTERVEAKSATLKDGYWDLHDAWVLSSQSEPQFYQSYLVSTYLTRDQIKQTITDPKAISFWELPAFIDHAERAGLATEPYRLQWHRLLSRPFLLVAMVVIAATASLRFFRFGGIGRRLLVGITAGFLFLVLTWLMGDLGSSGLIAPVMAAWAPVIVVTLAGLTVLLYQEDG